MEQDYFMTFTKKAILLMGLWGIVIYANSLGNAFIGDDVAQIVSNPAIHSLTNLFSFFSASTFQDGAGIYYKPFLMTAYAFLYAVFGTWTPGYHLVQILLHITNATLIYLIFKKYCSKEIVAGIALIFLLHPINVEAVVSIAALQEPLFLLFGLLALWLTQRLKNSIAKYSAVTSLLLLSLLSKETGVVFLLLVPLFENFLGHKLRISISQSVVAFMLYLTLRMGVAHIFFSQPQSNKSPLLALDLGHRLFNGPAIFFFYLKTFGWPQRLLIYQRWLVTSVNPGNFYLPLLVSMFFLVLLAGATYWIYTRSRKNLKLFLFFLIWFLAGLSLHLQIIPIDYTVADRWFYLPIIGLLGMIGVLMNIWNFHHNPVIKKVSIGVFIAILVAFSARDIARNANWKNALTLYQHDIQFEPQNYSLQSTLGIELYNIGKLDEAKAYLLTSIGQWPNNQNWTALGFVDLKANDIANAETAFRQALSYKDDPMTYQSLIKVMTVHDDPHTTAEFISTYTKKFPGDPFLWLYLSVENYQLGNRDQALSEVRRSNALYPSPESVYVYQTITKNEKIKLINN